MKNITLSADDALIAAARERARSENTTLNEQFRRWLADYARSQQRLDDYDAVMAQLRGRMVVGQRPDREAMNAR